MPAPIEGSICYPDLGAVRTGPCLVVLPQVLANRCGRTVVAQGTHRGESFTLWQSEFVATFRSRNNANEHFTFIKPYELSVVPTTPELLAGARPPDADALARFRERLPLFLWRQTELSRFWPPIHLDEGNRQFEAKHRAVRELERGAVVSIKGELQLVMSNNYYHRHSWYVGFLACPLIVVDPTDSLMKTIPAIQSRTDTTSVIPQLAALRTWSDRNSDLSMMVTNDYGPVPLDIYDHLFARLWGLAPP